MTSDAMRITFVMPGRGGGGGAHSVVQECLGLARMGLNVGLATTLDTAASFMATYPELENSPVRLYNFMETAQLAHALDGSDIAVATTAPSAHLVDAAIRDLADPPRPAYYIQDYEPFFFTPGTSEWEAARASYSVLGDDALLFAKTEWLCAMVRQNHGRRVVKVAASLDHSVYYPRLGERSGPLVVAAMVRPRTPRRAPRRTIRALERIADAFQDKVRLVSFGCELGELQDQGLSPSDRIDHRGVLSRGEVAELLRGADLFLDLSDYQAFGRTALEAMACGCVSVLPVFGGGSDFGRHGENAYFVDVRSDEAILQAAGEYIGAGPATHERLRANALATALGYSIERAVISEHRAFDEFLRAFN